MDACRPRAFGAASFRSARAAIRARRRSSRRWTRIRRVAVAAVPDPSATNTIVAVGRFHSDGAERAELALLVEDGYQGNGLGRLLLERLLREARRRRLRVLAGHVLYGNAPILRLLRSLGLPLDVGWHGGDVLDFELSVSRWISPNRRSSSDSVAPCTSSVNSTTPKAIAISGSRAGTSGGSASARAAVNAPRKPPQASTARSAAEARLRPPGTQRTASTSTMRVTRTAAIAALTDHHWAIRLPRSTVNPSSRNTTALATKPKYSHRSSSSLRLDSVIPARTTQAPVQQPGRDARQRTRGVEALGQQKAAISQGGREGHLEQVVVDARGQGQTPAARRTAPISTPPNASRTNSSSPSSGVNAPDMASVSRTVYRVMATPSLTRLSPSAITLRWRGA